MHDETPRQQDRELQMECRKKYVVGGSGVGQGAVGASAGTPLVARFDAPCPSKSPEYV